MRSFLRNFVQRTAKNNFLWNLIYTKVIKVGEFAKHARANRTLDPHQRTFDIETAAMAISPDLTVRHGPFRGMRYPTTKSVGSALVPKILGSYESELHSIVDRICRQEYSDIVDIGCAEGYYAVGLAMRLRNANIYAYDTNKDAIRLCKQMARLNNVMDRLTTGDFCDSNTLRSLPLGKRALIVSDCEGYEKILFTKETASHLANHELLIEIHDFIDIEISSMIRQAFQDTHHSTVVQSIDDIAKARSYDYKELQGYDLAARKALLAEGRPNIMEWFYLVPNGQRIGS